MIGCRQGRVTLISWKGGAAVSAEPFSVLNMLPPPPPPPILERIHRALFDAFPSVSKISTLITPSPNSAYLATNAHLMKSESKWLMLGQLSAVRIFPQICSCGKINKNQCNMTQYTKYADTELKTFLSLHSGYFTHAQAVKWSLPMCVWREKKFLCGDY